MSNVGPLLLFVAFAAVCAIAFRAIAFRWSVAARSRLLRWMLFLLLATVTAAVVTAAFTRQWSFRGDSPRFGLVAMVDGTAARPFVYRRLSSVAIGATAAAAESVLPRSVWAQLESASPLMVFRRQENPRLSPALEGWSGRKVALYHAAYVWMFVCTFATVVLARRLVLEILPGRLLLADVAPILGLQLLPVTFVHGGYFYDAAELLFLFAYALCVARRALLASVVVFALAVFNKESNLLLGIIGPVALWGSIDTAAWRRLAIAHAAIGVLIVGGLWYVYRGNPGAPLEVSFLGNLAFWTHPRNYIMPTYIFGPLIPVPRASNVFTLGLVALLVVTAWAGLPGWVRRGLSVSLLLVSPLLLLSSYRDEMRNLSIAFPFLFLSMALAAHNAYEGPAAAAPTSAPAAPSDNVHS